MMLGTVLRSTFIALALIVAGQILTSDVKAQDFGAGDDPFAQEQFLPVDQAFQFDYRQNGATLTFTWTVADGYYLYQHRFAPDPSVELAEVPIYPEGESHTDEFFGESIVYRDAVSITYVVHSAQADQPFTVSYQGCADAGLCYPPTTKTIYLSAVSSDGSTAISFEEIVANSQTDDIFDLGAQPLWLSLGIFLLLGIGLAFTPCVLPMYPIISAIIMGSGQHKQTLPTRRAFTLSFAYVQGMAITYSILGVIVALAGLKYQAMLQHPVILIGLALLFVVLALSMLGAYTIQLPQRWQQKLNEVSQQQRGGAHRSVFTMGALSGLIASPCTTAPLSGILLFIAQTGDITIGGAVLYALSIGMGIPLIIFGVSGGKLLPKAGAWMNTIKRIFGVILLGVALLFVERLLSYEVAGWLWVAFIDVAAIYLIISGYRELKRSAAHLFAVIWIVLGVGLNQYFWPSTYHQADFVAVDSVASIEAELASAGDKVVMLDLYADWCVACKEFERETFGDEDVQVAFDQMRILQADVTANNANNQAIWQKYRVLGLPTILFFYDGEEIPGSRVTGFMPAADFLQHIENCCEKR